ncbi:MAG: biotin--[Clostridia bacterium]|nr:biotin--[acetyl-CoA-carboxylase] ligase [Clostridia bacterium]
MKYTVKEYEVLSSTNDEMKVAALEGAKEGYVITALSQTAGRGRKGRSFLSPEGGLYLSLLLRPESTDHLTAAAAVAVCRAIHRLTGAEPSIKWPNDVYLNNMKISGILTEAKFTNDRYPEYVIVGVGVNIRRVEFSEDLSSKAASLEDCGYFADRKELIDSFLSEFDLIYSGGKDWLAEYRKRSLISGRKITVISPNETYTAVAGDIDEDAHLTVVRPNGRKTVLISGEVSILPE